MRPPSRLDTPPPPSQFRRPWSPDPYDPLPTTSAHYAPADGYDSVPRRREPSDVSVEALDLADYAQTLRTASRDHLSASAAASRSRDSLARPAHRPFSLPPPSAAEIDITQFPSWSRAWYDRPPPPAAPARSPFDPGYTHHSFPEYDADYDAGYDPYSTSLPAYPASSHAHSSTHGLLPWDAADDGAGKPSPALKAERLRMLEREFGPDAQPPPGPDARPRVGGVDARGALVTQGPRKRAAMRVLQVLLAAAAGVPAIYAAIVLKPKAKPPPQGSPAAYVLYVLSVLTLGVLLYLFVVHPCCGSRRRAAPSMPGLGGMMVMPVQGGGKKGKKGKKGREGGDVQVNLIVDPRAFSGPAADDDDDDDAGSSVPGAFSNSQRGGRRSVFAGLAMEEAWRTARSWARRVAIVDAAGVLLWGAEFVYILIGKRCPSGQFDGWCNAYNVSSAAACLLCVAFGISIFFDVKDLHASKDSPRTRT